MTTLQTPVSLVSRGRRIYPLSAGLARRSGPLPAGFPPQDVPYLPPVHVGSCWATPPLVKRHTLPVPNEAGELPLTPRSGTHPTTRSFRFRWEKRFPSKVRPCQAQQNLKMDLHPGCMTARRSTCLREFCIYQTGVIHTDWHPPPRERHITSFRDQQVSVAASATGAGVLYAVVPAGQVRAAGGHRSR